MHLSSFFQGTDVVLHSVIHFKDIKLQPAKT